MTGETGPENHINSMTDTAAYAVNVDQVKIPHGQRMQLAQHGFHFHTQLSHINLILISHSLTGKVTRTVHLARLP